MKYQAIGLMLALFVSLGGCKNSLDFGIDPVVPLDVAVSKDVEAETASIEAPQKTILEVASPSPKTDSSLAALSKDGPSRIISIEQAPGGMPNMPPLGGPSESFGPAGPPPLPPVPAVPLDAYGDQAIYDALLGSARIWAIPYSVCGNAHIEPREQCDDGNFDNEDGCNNLCRFPLCGNGLLELNEFCDDNNNTASDGCTVDCVQEFCGNGRIDPPLKTVNNDTLTETCDNGPNDPRDGCNCCIKMTCGDQIVQPVIGEECEPKNGDLPAPYTCSDCCKIVPTPTSSSETESKQ